MSINALLAALCLVPLAASMYLGNYGHDFGIDTPDRKIFRRNAFGQIQAFDVSTETRYVPNAYGGLSSYNVMEISDPDIYTNTVGGYSPMTGGLTSQFGNQVTRFPTPFNTMTNFMSAFPSAFTG